ncbi:MAG: hypothetical protein ABI691_21675 [Ginsengibacter sp.]
MIQIKLIKVFFLATFILNVGCQLVLLQHEIFSGNGLTNCVYIANPGRIIRMNDISNILIKKNYRVALKSQKDKVMLRELLNETLTQRCNKFKLIEREITLTGK